MNYRGEYIDRMAARVGELDTEIRKLEELATMAVEEIKAEYQDQINNLFLKKEELKNQVDMIQKASGDVWEDLKAGSELSWEAFDESIKSRIKTKK